MSFYIQFDKLDGDIGGDIYLLIIIIINTRQTRVNQGQQLVLFLTLLHEINVHVETGIYSSVTGSADFTV